MYHWFQNLKKEDNEKRWFHFRGSLGKSWQKTWFKYSAWSGSALRFEYQHGEADDGGESSMFTIGLIFFTVCLTFYLPKKLYFERKCIATWDNNREFFLIDGRKYGFYFYEWSFVWAWHAKIHESSSCDPWWMHQYWHLDDWVLGKRKFVENDLISNENILFKLGEKEFKMNSIQWKRREWFRAYIPFSLYHKTIHYVEMKIEKPPMRAGKGENSWDCGDDGTFGLYQSWPFEIPTYQNKDTCTEKAIGLYVDGVLKDAKRYGGSKSKRGIRRDDVFTYIGKLQPTPPTQLVTS